MLPTLLFFNSPFPPLTIGVMATGTAVLQGREVPDGSSGGEEETGRGGVELHRESSRRRRRQTQRVQTMGRDLAQLVQRV